MAREFEIGDVVEIGSETQLAEVVGVIHDSECVFVLFPGEDKEKRFPFEAVIKQWREVPSNA